MKKTLTLLLLFIAVAAAGQNAARIRRDAAYLWAEGRGETLHTADSAALAGLCARIAAQSGLSSALGATYMEDLRRVTSRLVEGRYTVLRYLEAGRIDEVFTPRRERIDRLIRQAEQSGDAQYYSLAYTLARSVPGYPADHLELLRKHATGHWILQDFVSREADAVLAALEPRKDLPQADAPRPSALPRKQPEIEHVTIQDTIIVEKNLGKLEVEHTFSRRDTLVIIPGSYPGGTTAVPLQKATRTPRALQGFLLAQLTVLPDLSYGAMAGLGGPVWGGYLRFGSNFRTVSPAYDCRSDGTTDFGVVWSSGGRSVSRLCITGGVWMQCLEKIKIYAGAGYGRRIVCWQDTKGDWARVQDYNNSGLALDAGIMLDLGHFSFSLSGEALAFRQFGLTVGAGVSF